MNAVIRHIEYLISRTDCVIIPGIGALLAHRQCARFDFDAQRVMPPCRTFSFNGQLTETDGSLAYSISRAEGISLEAASDKVKAETDAMKRQLMLDGQLSLGRVGNLAFDAESGAVTFNAFEADGLSLSTAWLPIVENRPAAEVAEPEIKTPVRISSPWARFVRVAASIAILLGICFVASTPIVVDEMLLASLSPEIQPIASEELLPLDDQPLPTLRISFAAEEQATEEAEPQDEAIPEQIAQPAQDGKYLVIVGWFNTHEEAAAFVAKKYPETGGVIERADRIRAYSGAYATEAEARAQAEAIGNAWVYMR